MILSNPITIQPPIITRSNGEVRNFNPITLNELDIIIFDNVKRKSCMVRIGPCPRPLALWEKEAYDTIGDYTQAQVEDRINELLGDSPVGVLEGLFSPLSKPV